PRHPESGAPLSFDTRGCDHSDIGQSPKPSLSSTDGGPRDLSPPSPVIPGMPALWVIPIGVIRHGCAMSCGYDSFLLPDFLPLSFYCRPSKLNGLSPPMFSHLPKPGRLVYQLPYCLGHSRQIIGQGSLLPIHQHSGNPPRPQANYREAEGHGLQQADRHIIDSGGVNKQIRLLASSGPCLLRQGSGKFDFILPS